VGETPLRAAGVAGGVDALRIAHEQVNALLARRTAAVNEANRINGRLSRLSDWLGDGRPWMRDAIDVADVDVPWRILQWVARAWPK
jgi:hypothetical protein